VATAAGASPISTADLSVPPAWPLGDKASDPSTSRGTSLQRPLPGRPGRTSSMSTPRPAIAVPRPCSNHYFTLTGALRGITSPPTARTPQSSACNTSREVTHDRVPPPPRRPPAGDPRQPAAPDRYVYQLADSKVWLFPKSSRIYRSKGGSIRAPVHPRWTLPDELQHLIKDDWHAYTGYPRSPSSDRRVERTRAGMRAARLCDHTSTWDDPHPLPHTTAPSQPRRPHPPEYRTRRERNGCIGQSQLTSHRETPTR